MKTNQTPEPVFPVVGIGASAGGLEPLKEFFNTMPPDCGMAFVVVTHRDPEGVNLLPEILGRVTKMPVVEAGNLTQVSPGHVYVSPAAHHLGLHRNRLVFHALDADGRISLPVDFFFRSLAEERKDKSICIILSGNGSDGTLGLRAIKGEGGAALAQDPATAQFDGMPVSAIETGQVDYVLDPKKMPEQLIQYVSSAKARRPAKSRRLLREDTLAEILALVRRHTGNDFSAYKPNTLERRIERRMNIHHIPEERGYVKYLAENPHEIDLLFREMLIGVTGFFRDPASFETLEKDVLPPLLKDKGKENGARFWVAACSTGEEAYSLAILLQEYQEREKQTFPVQIFATDLDDRAVNKARAGIYANGIALDVSPQRLQKYFSHEDGHYRVRKHLRDMVVFAVQNLIQDPPFTKLDLLSCRNLLIYLDGATQKRLIPLFHYSLRPGGVLMLGASETAGEVAGLFAPLQAKAKIFLRKDSPLPARLPRVDFPQAGLAAQKTEEASEMPKDRQRTANITELAQRLLLTAHIPPSVIVNERGEIYFIHGRTGLYLEPSPGQAPASHNVLDMAREGLQLSLATALRKAAGQEEEVLVEGVRVRTNGDFTSVNLRARKITEPEALRGMIWISFEGAKEPPARPAETASAAPPENEQAERELHFIKQNLRNTIEELETSNEELTSANEELQSTNEELQSTNEELETAKEEMQSLNEELHTVNAELETKVSELAYANDDMQNLLNSTGIATIFLDNELNIKRFTMHARKIMNLIPGDIGRPFGDIVSQLEYTGLAEDAAGVLRTLAHREIEVRARDWSWYLVRIMPYRAADNAIDGLVITGVDITNLKKSQILLSVNVRALQMIALENAPLAQVLDELLLTIERQATDLRCGISIIAADGKHLRHVSAPSLPKAFYEALDGVEIATGAPCGEAAALGKPVICPDIARQARQDGFAALALKHDIRAAWAQPIFSGGGNLIGVLSVYYRAAHEPTEFETELISQTLPLMGTAIARHHET